MKTSPKTHAVRAGGGSSREAGAGWRAMRQSSVMSGSNEEVSREDLWGGGGAKGWLNTRLRLKKVGDGQEGGKAKTQRSQARHGCHQPTF